MYRILVFLTWFVIASSTYAAESRISNADAVSGLRQALIDGSTAAVAQLGVENGFLGNAKVKIPLPPALQRIESALRYTGMRRQADELVIAMNRAAEAAVPEAQTLLVQAVRKMSVNDAKGILSGGDTAATQYFRHTTEKQLASRFRPIVKRATDQVGLAEQYNSLAGQAVQLGLIKQDQATIDGYVTQKALDGLFLMIAEQEKSFRQNPLAATSDIVKRVFGAMR
jgi:hypothetical protein